MADPTDFKYFLSSDSDFLGRINKMTSDYDVAFHVASL